MSGYFLAPALAQLRAEVDDRFPRRDRASDGWIGDPSHAARVSDHNPCWACSGRLYGIVRALDIDISPDGNPRADLRRQILNVAVGDRRVWYVISNGIIYSRTHGWTARRYTGSNGHYAHVHVSLAHGVAEFDTSSWFEPTRPKIKAIPVSLIKVREQFLAAVEGRPVEFNNGVGRIQKVLRSPAHGEDLVVDGLVGASTLNAWGRFERRRDGQGRPRVPDERSLALLARGRFRVVK